MKALIVIDMPKTCAECRASFCGDVWYCYAGEYRRPLFTENIQEKPLWCPLRPLPEKIEEGEEPNIKYGISEYAVGRNDVIDEILGETE